MPWNETCPVSERINFINDWIAEKGSVSGLCETYGITRETGHLWICRFKQGGYPALEDRTKALQPPLNNLGRARARSSSRTPQTSACNQMASRGSDVEQPPSPPPSPPPPLVV
ncbi:MAG: hypothetical protein ICCCNLDF_03591 [Planctomycetes bacterium]|nr:hypothetical protein [Planctomycetota bacterium]